jgi:hypothetical protein
MVGFVRMNSGTLGSAASGATEFASSTASALFAYLWAYLPNSIAPVSSGRGVSAAADFAANKTIVIPSMRGYGTAGVDGMGVTPVAGVIQAVTTCNTNGATGVVVVASATGIAVGQFAIVNNVAAGTVTAISGTNITLSAIPAGPAAGVAFRSSFFSDAELVGAAAGSPNAQPTIDQMPTHAHTYTDPGHIHGINQSALFANGGSNAITGPGTNVNTSSSVTGITINNTGGGHPFGILQPTRLGTWYMKL